MSTGSSLQHATLERVSVSARLESLATGILLDILCRLPDLASLASLIQASAVVDRMFESYAVEITEAVLGSGYMCGHIRVMVRIMAIIRSSTLPIQSLREFKHRVTSQSLMSTTGFGERKGDSVPKLCPGTPARQSCAAYLRRPDGLTRLPGTALISI